MLITTFIKGKIRAFWLWTLFGLFSSFMTVGNAILWADGPSSDECDDLYASKSYVEAAECYSSLNPPDYWRASDSYGRAGNVAFEQGNYEQAYLYYQQEVNYANLTTDFERKAIGYYHLGQAAYATGRYEESKTEYSTAGEYYSEVPDYWRASDSYGWAGNVAYELGSYDQAYEYYQLEVTYADMTSDSQRKAEAHYHAGQAAYATGKYDESMTNYETSGDNYLLVSDYWKAGDAYAWAGNAASASKNWDAAISYYVVAAENFIDAPDYQRTGDCFRQAGDAANFKGDCPTATLYWEKARQYYNLAGIGYNPPSCVTVYNSDVDQDRDVDGADLAHFVSYFVSNFGSSNCNATYKIEVVGNANGSITFGKQLCEDGNGELWYEGFSVAGDGGGAYSGVDVILPFATHSPPLRFFPPEPGDEWSSSGESAGYTVNSIARVVSRSETVNVPAGSFENCVKVVENLSYPGGYTSGQPYPVKYERWFAPGVGPVKLIITEKAADGTTETKYVGGLDSYGNIASNSGDYFPLGPGFRWTFTLEGRTCTWFVSEIQDTCLANLDHDCDVDLDDLMYFAGEFGN
ncbi:MAG: tetratricopeptide repeat protein [Deltaproteobacteria bacterium]|nr:tetratricopeptide repeat protein [Deltaproteobacteria bacterium]MBW1950620.1 tetratricopeptide repeat protein [Deltaproteobacteria bacterium]MBW2348238.1 tetratricopeptide repeat protein [Deltaproteobacteria bacterium]